MMAQAAGISQLSEVIAPQEDQVSRSKSDNFPDHFALTIEAMKKPGTQPTDVDREKSAATVSDQHQNQVSLLVRSSVDSISGRIASQPLGPIVRPTSAATDMIGAELPAEGLVPGSDKISLPVSTETNSKATAIVGSEVRPNPSVTTVLSSPDALEIVDAARSPGELAGVGGHQEVNVSRITKVAVSEQKTQTASHHSRPTILGKAVATENPLVGVPPKSEDPKSAAALCQVPADQPLSQSVLLSPPKGAPVLSALVEQSLPVTTTIAHSNVPEQSDLPGFSTIPGTESCKPGVLSGATNSGEQAMGIGTVEAPGISLGTLSSFSPSLVAAAVTPGSTEAAANHPSESLSGTGHHMVEPEADSLAGTLRHTIVTATPTSLEVGVSSGTHGWLKIRAELTGAGEVSASLSGSTSASTNTLRGELPALSSYLQQEKISVGELVVHTVTHALSAETQQLPSASLNSPQTLEKETGDLSGGLANGSSGGRSDREARPDPSHIPIVGDRESLLAAKSDISAERDRVNLSSIGSRPLFEYGTGGSWVNVRA